MMGQSNDDYRMNQDAVSQNVQHISVGPAGINQAVDLLLFFILANT
jgi:hypothetical protein